MAGDTKSLSPHDRARLFLLFTTVVTGLLYVVPYGRLIGYPLMLLSTAMHEMGHGVAAMLVGGEFRQFTMWSDGSGVATAALAVDSGRFAKATFAAGGLIGPAIVAGLAFVAGRTEKGARVGLWIFGGVLVIAEVMVVRGAFAMAFVAAVAAIALLIAWKAKPWGAQLATLFVAVQLAMTVFSRGDYLFTESARTAGGTMPSDTARIAEALFLPYWFWGAMCGLVSVAVLVLGLRAFFRSQPPSGPASAA